MRQRTHTHLTRTVALTAVAGLVASGVVAATAAPAPAAPAVTDPAQQFLEVDYTGAPQTFQLPDGVQRLAVDIDGAEGADGQGQELLGGGGEGGNGTRVVGAIDVAGQNSVVLRVGGQGSKTVGGYNGGGTGGTGGYTTYYGGGGGGATDIRTPSGTKLVVAAGGGGGGGSSITRSDGGAGGASSTAAGAAGGGGAGGHSTGGAGGAGGTAGSGTGGNGQTASAYGTGSGGGGGGGLASGQGGKRGTSHLAVHYGAGGGGGSGSSYAAPGTSGLFFRQAGDFTGDGDATLYWVKIDTHGLPDGLVGQPYSTTLEASTFLDTVTWAVVGTLPAGLSLNASTGVVSGTPTAPFQGEVTVSATDSVNGAVTNKTFALDIVGFDPSGIAVLDSPATAVTAHTATANGSVHRLSSLALSDVYCRYGTSADTAAGTVVAATPGTATAGDTTVDVTCGLADLAPDTKYYYSLFAVTGGVTVGSNSPQSFTTLALATQTAQVPFPKKVKFKGRTVVMPRTVKTSAGKVLRVKVKRVSAASTRGDVTTPLYRVIRKKHKVVVQTFGKKRNWYLRLTYLADGNAQYLPFKQQRVYRVTR